MRATTVTSETARIHRNAELEKQKVLRPSRFPLSPTANTYGSYDTNGKGSVRGHFGDYWSCSNIRVSGGNLAPIQGKAAFKPQLVTGKDKGTCKSLGNKLGICAVEPCPNAYGNAQPREMCPAGFNLSGGKCFSPLDNKKPVVVPTPTRAPSNTSVAAPTPTRAPSKNKCCDLRRRVRPHIGGIYARTLNSRGIPGRKRCLCRNAVLIKKDYPYGVAFEVVPVGQKDPLRNTSMFDSESMM